MSALRQSLQLQSEADVARDVESLRRSNTKGGNWSLEQICWHLEAGLKWCLRPPSRLEATDEELAMQKRLDQLLAAGMMPPGLKGPPQLVPPTEVAPESVDEFLSGLKALANYPNSHVDFGPFGPVTIDKFRRFVLIHSAHHLEFLSPTAKRREGLQFANEDAMIADIQQLRRGYTMAGNWDLPQVCWHLNKTMQSRMQPGPFPPDSAEQIARRPILAQLMATGRLPEKRLDAPPAVVPPIDAGDDAIDAFLATTVQFKNFPGPVAPHRLFGTMSDVDAHRQTLIHCAHHLSFLVPTNAVAAN